MSRDAKVSACDGTAEPASSVLKISTFFPPRKRLCIWAHLETQNQRLLLLKVVRDNRRLSSLLLKDIYV